MKQHDQAICQGLLEDAGKREEILRHERVQAVNELRDVRSQLTGAYRQRDDERAEKAQALQDLDQKDHELAELKAEIEDLRARLSRPLIPEAPPA